MRKRRQRRHVSWRSRKAANRLPSASAANNVGVYGFLATPVTSYSVCLLYDPTKAVHSGATIPIKLQTGPGWLFFRMAIDHRFVLLRFDVTSTEPPPQGVDTIGDPIWNRIGGRLKCLKV